MPKKKKPRIDPAALTQSFSKNLLGLKFMQRAQSKTTIAHVEDYESEDDDEEELNDQVVNKNPKKKCILNPSYQFCERLRFGRFSFQGMNLDIESLMYKEGNTEHNNSNRKIIPNTDRGKRPLTSSSSSGSSDASGGDDLGDDEE